MQNRIPGNNGAHPSNHDNDVRTNHDQAVARGEKRVLCRTVDGGLHSYARDEIGVLTASSHPTVRTAGGFTVMAVFFAALAAFSLLLVSGPTASGEEPLWGALALTVMGLGGAVYAGRLAAIAARAKRIRRERGIPDPTSRQFD